jgi:hypothetical protein
MNGKGIATVCEVDGRKGVRSSLALIEVSSRERGLASKAGMVCAY